MELETFVKSVLTQLDNAVESARAETKRDIKFSNTADNRSVEFDIAVTVEQAVAGKAEGGIKVLELVKAGADVAAENKNQTVSRIKFGLEVEVLTKDEEVARQQHWDEVNRLNAEKNNNLFM